MLSKFRMCKHVQFSQWSPKANRQMHRYIYGHVYTLGFSLETYSYVMALHANLLMSAYVEPVDSIFVDDAIHRVLSTPTA